MMITLMYLAANPMERDYYLTGLFWLYFLVNRESLAKLQAEYGVKRMLAPIVKPIIYRAR
ncbi:MAG: hypothetical protein EOP48_24705 [Sphingobacteriales bacterium]|nr:MAG: hypothetical protein EOP48_24705 [Sphingobacteriales bacterium]